MNLYFYIRNKRIKKVDLSKPWLGNPGCGGTEYLTVALCYYLDKHTNLKPILFANSTKKLPSNLHIIKEDSIEDVIKKVAEMSNGLLFINVGSFTKSDKKLLEEYRVNAIAWLRNHPSVEICNLLADCNNIKRVVCVGREELDRIRDHRIFKKSTYIYHIYDLESIVTSRNNKNNDKIVCYIGSMIPLKGFHRLARIWPSILKELPDAKLWVIGDGTVYGSNNVLGKWNIAEESYESSWRRYLSDENGNPHSSVKFWGKLGTEKYEILSNVTVGVPNPSGQTETFGSSAVDFLASGVPVVTARCHGFLDTVPHKRAGYLCSKSVQLRRNIIKLLNDATLNRKMGEYGKEKVIQDFSVKKIIPQWEELVNDIRLNKSNKLSAVEKNWFFEFKWLREVNRLFKTWPGLRRFPSLIEIRCELGKIRRFISALIN